MFVNDSLKSLLGSLGDPSRDKMAGTYYGFSFMTDDQLINAYRGSWLPRKVVDIPAMDSVRAWRAWSADSDDVGRIEREENRLGLRLKVLEAKTKARLLGGSAIYIGTGEDDLSKPLNPGSIGRGGVKFLTVLSRVECQAGEIEIDPISPYFGRPKFYRVSREGREIHPSRFAIMIGLPHPEPRYNMLASAGWGDSILLPVLDALKNVDASAMNAANLLFEANVDVFGVPDMMESLTDPRYEKLMIDRFALVAANKGINRSILRDATETFERKAITFNGVPDVLEKLMQIAAGATDIPATRLLGMSPSGMSATGESDLRNYYDRVNVGQELETGPALALLDECVVRSALGDYPNGTYYSWRSLWQMGAKEIAETAKAYAETATNLASAGLVDIAPLGKATVNQMAEIGAFPGIENAISEFAATGKIEFTADAAPRTLYIRRDVLNGAEILAWAREQGFEGLQDASELHVTIIHSVQPVDWIKIGESYAEKMTINEGGPRIIEIFGRNHLVIQFASNELRWRNADIIENGASTEWPEYQPHVTFARFEGLPPILSGVKPYTGRIELGPEIFEEVRP